MTESFKQKLGQTLSDSMRKELLRSPGMTLFMYVLTGLYSLMHTTQVYLWLDQSYSYYLIFAVFMVIELGLLYLAYNGYSKPARFSLFVCIVVVNFSYYAFTEPFSQGYEFSLELRHFDDPFLLLGAVFTIIFNSLLWMLSEKLARDNADKLDFEGLYAQKRQELESDFDMLRDEFKRSEIAMEQQFKEQLTAGISKVEEELKAVEIKAKKEVSDLERRLQVMEAEYVLLKYHLYQDGAATRYYLGLSYTDPVEGKVVDKKCWVDKDYKPRDKKAQAAYEALGLSPKEILKQIADAKRVIMN